MLVSIGMLAWNEADGIEKTIESLLMQSVFNGGSVANQQIEWEIVIVPNGCTDDTGSVARMALSEYTSGKNNISYRVVDVEEAGKSNAWNLYVHEFSNIDADFLILMDADIEFGNIDTIKNTLAKLIDTPTADVSVDLPLKSFHKKDKKTIFESISAKFSGYKFDGPPGIAGSFYCARVAVLRNIWMPKGLSGEDGFLRAMVITNLFRSEIDFDRVVRARNAEHYYDPETKLKKILRHQLRLIIGTSLNCFLTWDALFFMTDPEGSGAGVLIKNNIDKDGDWYKKFIENSIQTRGFWVLPRGMIFSRFKKAKEKSGLNKAIYLFVVSALFVVEMPLYWVANRKIKSMRAIGFW